MNCNSCGAALLTSHCAPCYAKAHPGSRRLRLRQLRAEGKSECCKCLRVLPLERFDVRPDRGLPATECKDCRSKRDHARRYHGVSLPHSERDQLAALGLKHCSKCRVDKPFDAFQKARRRPDGLQAYCRACVNANYRRNYAAAPEVFRERNRAQRERHHYGRAAISPEAHRAHMAVHRAVKIGALTRPECCSACGTGTAKAHAHHDDYSKPLDVIWLCAPCHKLAHALHDAANDGFSLPTTRKPSEFLQEALALRSAS